MHRLNIISRKIPKLSLSSPGAPNSPPAEGAGAGVEEEPNRPPDGAGAADDPNGPVPPDGAGDGAPKIPPPDVDAGAGKSSSWGQALVGEKRMRYRISNKY